MSRRATAFAAPDVAIALGLGCSAPQRITFEELFSDLDRFTAEIFTVDGFYFGGTNITVLSADLDFSGVATDHLVPSGWVLWLKGDVPQDVLDGLQQQELIGSTEHFGRVRVTGWIEHGGGYGYVGGYSYQVVPARIEAVPWPHMPWYLAAAARNPVPTFQRAPPPGAPARASRQPAFFQLQAPHRQIDSPLAEM